MLDFGDEYFEGLTSALREIEEAFLHMDELLKELAEEKFFERDPIPETPYIFRGQSRVYDKRPHKQHRCRNNC